MKTTIRKRLEKDLQIAGARLRQELPGATGDDSSGADELDESQSITSREIGWTTREMLVERVNRLSAALDRLRDGVYGVCIECNEPLAPARLRVMPEVETCVGCQSGRERLDRQVGRSSRERAGLALTGTE